VASICATIDESVRSALSRRGVRLTYAGVPQLMQLPSSAISTWGVGFVFLNVLLTRLGVPVPAAPVLLLAGSAIASGLISFWYVLAAAVLGALIGDCVWFTVGRIYGRRVLNALAQLSLSVDTSVRRAGAWFERFGAPILSVSKFVPGLALITPPLMGSTRIDPRIFVAWDLTGVVAWATFWVLGGALFEKELGMLLSSVRAHGGTLVDVLVIVSIAYFVYRWIQRRRFRRWLAHIRISPEQLEAMMRSERPPVILDARPDAIRKAEPHRIPGAMLVDLSSPDKIDAALLEHGLVVYCVCPNEATAKQIAQQMSRKGFTRVHALKGGLDAWERRGYPVEPLPSRTEAVEESSSSRDVAPEVEGAVTLRAFAPK
jgi:membrane protein DedA with SNARE-associated domain/rhodanese-related sulfurtransferase